MENEKTIEEIIQPEKPFWKKWWFWLVAIFVIIIIASAGGGEEKETTSEIAPFTQKEISQSPQEEVQTTAQQEIIFDIPSLFGKSFSQLKTILGSPTRQRAPTDYDFGWAEWDKEGLTLSINFDERGRLIDTEIGCAIGIVSKIGSEPWEETKIRQATNLTGANYPFLVKPLKREGKVYVLDICYKPETTSSIKQEKNWQTIKTFSGSGRQKLELVTINTNWRWIISWEGIPMGESELYGIWRCEDETYSYCWLFERAFYGPFELYEGSDKQSFISTPTFRDYESRIGTFYFKVEADSQIKWKIEIQI